MEGRHAVPGSTRSRVSVLLITLATACGLWFGITAPDVSPVAPPVGPGVEAPAFPVVTTGDAP